MKWIFVFCLCGILFSCQKRVVMESPSGKVSADVFVRADGTLGWTATFAGQLVNDTSALGVTVEDRDLFRDAELQCVKTEVVCDSYPTRGVHSIAINNYKGYHWKIVTPEQAYGLEMRLYDDGVAYRFIVPGEGKRTVKGEVAQWRLPLDSRVWFAERLSDWKLMTYAGEWIQAKATELCRISSQGAIQTMPLVYELPQGKYALVTEAALYNYSGMRLRAEADGSVNADFTEKEGFTLEGEIKTPWRVLLLADDLNGLVNSDLITNLNPAPDLRLFNDVTWIKGGRSVWSWWSEIGGEYMTMAGEMKTIDAAKQLGFEFTTLDEGWERLPQKWESVKQLADYAASRNVGIYLWKHWNTLNDTADDYRVMRNFMDSVVMAGAKGLKIDFMNGEGLRQIHFDERALQLAAERRLMINFHGCQKPSGEVRTYPNELTREGVRGMELNRITAYYEKKHPGVRAYVPGGENQNIPSSHNAVLPFTRCVLGAADYTPVGFSRRGQTTPAHQLASAYLITSPLLSLAENPMELLENRLLAPALDFIRELPAQWDETRVLPQSKMGEVAAFARRSGDRWFLAVLNVNPCQLRFDLNFLGKGSYTMTLIEDADSNDRYFTLGKSRLDASASLPLNLQENGGAVVMFQPL